MTTYDDIEQIQLHASAVLKIMESVTHKQPHLMSEVSADAALSYFLSVYPKSLLVKLVS